MPAAPPPLLTKSVIDFLRRHAPYSHMGETHLALMARQAQLNYFADGTVVADTAAGPPRWFHVITRGSVLVHDPAAPAGQQTELALHAGDSFPLGAMIEGSAVIYDHVARGDTFCYEFGRALFDTLLRESAPFADFCTRRLAHLLQASRRHAHARAAADVMEQYNMSSLLGALLRRTPVACTPGTALREVLGLMREHKVGSVIAQDEIGRVAGIFTERDLLNRVVLDQPGLDAKLDAPLAQVMTPAPLCLDENASAFDAALLMAQHGVRHVPVTRGGTLLGVIGERDLFSLQRTGVRGMHGAIRHATGAAALQAAAADVRLLARNLLAQGMAVEQLTQLIATLNDQLVQQAILIVTGNGAVNAIGDIDFCWIALGSEGRMEQTISTDQDNGIIFTAADAQQADAVRTRLLPLAGQINQLLARLGFPLCQGGIMAGNPQWCLSLAEWQARFGDWMRNPSPEALLNAAIFFDFRPMHGNTALAASLREWLSGEARARPAFLHMLAANALTTVAPLGYFGDIADTGTVDLKTQGVRPFIDAARVLALAHAIVPSHTAQRLRLASAQYGAAAEAEAMVEAFHFIQLMRLTRQFKAIEDGGPPNAIELASLNELDRRILREAFRQGRKLQTRLRLDYGL